MKKIKQFFYKIVRDAIKNDTYALLDEIDRLRVDNHINSVETYDLVFATILANKIKPKTLVKFMDDKAVQAYVKEFQKELDKDTVKKAKNTLKETKKQIKSKSKKA